MNTLLKFDGPRLDELLERVQRELGPEVAIVEANRTRKGGVGGFFAKEWFEVIVDPASVPTVDPFLAMASAVADVRETAQPFSTETAADTEPQAGSVPDTFELALATAQRSAVTSTVPATSAVPATPTVPAPAISGTPAITPAPAIPTPEARASEVATARRLCDLDLTELLAHLDQLVPDLAIPSQPGAIVAVVGDPTSVRSVAVAVASRLGLVEADVVVAGPEPTEVSPWLAVTDVRTARARASRWRDSDRPTVVAVELSPGADGHAWAAAMLEALGADQVRLVAKAWQLTDQLGAKAKALGGVDGLDLVEMDAAAEPELFLELDLAVLGIDGRHATPELWAALMYERRTDHRDQ